MNRHNTIFYFAFLSALASALNYLTYPLLGRILNEEQFINTAVALSLLTQISTILLSIIALTIGLTKEKKDNQTTIEHLQAAVIKLFLIVIASFTILSPLLFQSISLPTAFVLPVALLLLFSVPSSVFSGYLNGKKKMVKVGLVTLITSGFQFLLTILAALLFTSGLVALVAMALGQLTAIILISQLYKNEDLPRISFLKKQKQKTVSSDNKQLYKYAIYASLGILAINLLQVLDLLVINANGADTAIYTDIYVISRAVYFAGIIFVWPYLSSIDLKKPRKNIKPTLNLLSFAFAVSVLCAIFMWFFGDKILNVAMGTNYSLESVQKLSVLAIAYKFLWLGIMSITLYFTVLRNYFAFFIPLLMTVGFGAYMLMSTTTNSVSTVANLTVIALLGFLLSLLAFRISLRSPSTNIYTTTQDKEL